MPFLHFFEFQDAKMFRITIRKQRKNIGKSRLCKLFVDEIVLKKDIIILSLQIVLNTLSNILRFVRSESV